MKKIDNYMLLGLDARKPVIGVSVQGMLKSSLLSDTD